MVGESYSPAVGYSFLFARVFSAFALHFRGGNKKCLVFSACVMSGSERMKRENDASHLTNELWTSEWLGSFLLLREWRQSVGCQAFRFFSFFCVCAWLLLRLSSCPHPQCHRWIFISVLGEGGISVVALWRYVFKRKNISQCCSPTQFSRRQSHESRNFDCVRIIPSSNGIDDTFNSKIAWIFVVFQHCPWPFFHRWWLERLTTEFVPPPPSIFINTPSDGSCKQF